MLCRYARLIASVTILVGVATAAETEQSGLGPVSEQGVPQHRLKMACKPPGPPHTTQSIASGPSRKDLDRLVRGMPRGTVAAFAQTIQPLLMNNCTAAGCHGPRSESDYRLLRVPPDRPPSRRTTQRNLHATLQWIDHENPTASRLLTAPVRPHGTAETPVFTTQQMAQYRRLVDWVCLVANRLRQEVPATVARPEKPPVQSTPAEPPAVVLSPNPKVQRGAKIKQFVPADPFDPEIFNRRFFSE